MITKLEIMLDPEAYDGTYIGTVEKVSITEQAAQFLLNFSYDGRQEQILAEISFTKGLNRSTKMLRENGIKKVDELKKVKQIGFTISAGWVNINTLGESVDAGSGGGGSAATDTSKFLK